MTIAQNTYEILDKGMRYVGAHRLRPGQKTILCTEAEAKFYIEGGALRLADTQATTARQISAATAIPPAAEPEREDGEATHVAGDPTTATKSAGRAPRKIGG